MTMTDPKLDEFLTSTRRSGLIEQPVLDTYTQTLLGVTSARQAATHMIRDGLLTPFQTRLLLEGKYRGFVVNAKYKILELIAVGGMGAVYLCEHMLMRRLVAMKVLPRDISQAAGAVERFLREARAAASLDHPNLVRAFDVDRLSQGSNHCLVMEFVDGISLHHLVEKNGGLAVDRAVDYAIQAASGLQHAHDAGLIHRDIKPSNVLLSRGGTVKVLDLGLARFFGDKADNLTRQHGEEAILGTADFIAPEQAMNAPVDTRADIYSFGCTLYYILAGHPPFPDGNMSTKLIAHQTKDPTPIEQIRPDLPAGFGAVVAKMMAKTAQERYQTLNEVIAALQPYETPPDGLPNEADFPALCPAIRKLMVDPTKSTGTIPRMYRPTASTAEYLLPPVPTEPAPASTTGSRDSTIDLSEMPTWRGRPMVDTAMSSTTHPTGNATPRPAQRLSSPATPTTQGNSKLFKFLVGGFISLTVVIAALVAYQTNKPNSPTKSAAVKKVDKDQ